MVKDDGDHRLDERIVEAGNVDLLSGATVVAALEDAGIKARWTEVRPIPQAGFLRARIFCFEADLAEAQRIIAAVTESTTD